VFVTMCRMPAMFVRVMSVSRMFMNVVDMAFMVMMMYHSFGGLEVCHCIALRSAHNVVAKQK
jgi:hypothetical protein